MRTRPHSARAGFTLAEAAITIAIVGVGLTFSVQALKSATLAAAATQRQKVARELALKTIGDIASGQWWDEIELEREGTFADDDHPDYSWELALGDEEFPTLDQDEDWEQEPFDSLQHRRDVEDDRNREMGIEDDEDAVEPYERVRIKVFYPQLPGIEADPFVVYERWIPWMQVYGPDDEDVPQGALSDDELPGGTDSGTQGSGR